MTSGIVYKKPEDPLEYMVTEIEAIQELERHRNHKIKRRPTSKQSEKD